MTEQVSGPKGAKIVWRHNVIWPSSLMTSLIYPKSWTRDLDLCLSFNADCNYSDSKHKLQSCPPCLCWADRCCGAKQLVAVVSSWRQFYPTLVSCLWAPGEDTSHFTLHTIQTNLMWKIRKAILWFPSCLDCLCLFIWIIFQGIF